jgi:zinc transporter ZupT
MINFILGIISGVLGAVIFFKAPSPAWYVWVLFVLGAALFAFSFDVLIGSIKEHQKRAARLGFVFFALPGLVFLGASLILGF